MRMQEVVRLVAGLMVLAVLGGTPNPARAAEAPAEGTAISPSVADLDEGEPVDLRGVIMEVRPGRGTIVVAEREIRNIDIEEGGRRIKTAYRGLDGSPQARDAFRVGQYVQVKGVSHPHGYIAAFTVQKIEKPVEKKMIYKPVADSRKAARKAGKGAAAQ